ncbi:MAG: hypothetical protein E5W76_05455 [Mesorhizobium sp.]|nr:MAG: hypothetical protein E5W76_05455 [Mesorhizobium sp.]
MSDRVPCINPRCRRTFKREHESQEIICGKCFRMLPEAVRSAHRGFWREIRKWDRRMARTADELKIVRMRAVRNTLSMRLGLHWDVHIKAPLLAPDKPAGLETFMEEIGL